MGRDGDRRTILGLNSGNPSPSSRSTWSQVRLYLFSALEEIGLACSVYNVEPFGAIKEDLQGSLSFLPSFLYLKYRYLEENWGRSWLAFRLRSKNATRVLKRFEQCDAILQTSSTMFPMVGAPPVYLYIDATLPLALDGGAFSTSLLSDQVLKEAFEIDRLVYKRAAGIFTFSNWCKESVVRDFGVPSEKVHAVGVGMNLPETSVDSQKYPPRTILFVGKNFEQKGGPLLLEAFKRVRRTMGDARLVIAGCSPKISEDGVIVTGYVDRADPNSVQKLQDLYRSASLFVLPSSFETFGISFLEAMYFETPCIALRRCAFPEFVIDGKTGSLISGPEPGILADAMVKLLKDERTLQAMGRKARQVAATRYTWTSVAQRMKQVMVED